MPSIRESAAEHRDRGSRFLALAFSAPDLPAVESRVKQRRREIRKACHHMWACRLVVDGRLVEQARDDGEVGRPGHVLLELLRTADLVGAVVVSRIFGGTKLGPGGVARAVREAARQALSASRPARRPQDSNG